MTESDVHARLRNLRKTFGDHNVLRGVDLDVRRGRSLVVIGGSGCGKSVMLRCLLGLITPDEGSKIDVDDQSCVNLKGDALNRHRARFGMLFQGGALFDSLRVWENVAFPLVHRRGMRFADAKPLALDALARVGLADSAEKFPAALSGGMQKRAALARAISSTPQILLFDEPTTGLDPILGGAIDRLIASAVRELGATAVSITHDMASARRIADDVALLHDGRVAWRGSPQDLDHAEDPLVRQFVDGRPDGPIDPAAR